MVKYNPHQRIVVVIAADVMAMKVFIVTEEMIYIRFNSTTCLPGAQDKKEK